MALGVKVPKKDGEKIRRMLIDIGAYNPEYKIKREGDFLIIPVKYPVEGLTVIEADLERVNRRPNSYKEIVNIPPSLKTLLPTSFDIIGDIAIIEIPEKLLEYRKEIGEAILKVHKGIKAVFMKGSKVQGKYRVRELIHIAGVRKTETIHRENGIRLKLDVSKVYFSPRLATERRRIYERSKEGEIVFDMFAGVGPYSILLAKKVKMVFACDINPWAIIYLEENIRINKINNVVPILGDVRKVAGKLKADRIIMNLPRYAGEFLREAFMSIKNEGVIHYYGFGPEHDPYGEHIARIEKISEEFDAKIKILDKRIIRNYAPRQYNIALDFQVIFS
ncbi:class I SAM-dependent methyltransferase family protein [Pyrococcus sp. ST04]|uniref:class I SAM-dependent methyltransferase n=1 Tax=Pyrococcus sp. ST04 TaxID=1183377 RepID=UPI0002605BE2|nr:class I SAM-dependent methyltransferase family protein [Pyrococcus sp. ST04]AFK22910.1 putative met-10+ protein [Pyrococcus sp. ST04]